MKKSDKKNEQKIVVFKFGGSALSSSEGQQTLKNEVLKAKTLAKNQNDSCPAYTPVFVLSAIGKTKKNENDEKLTDLLIAYNEALKSGVKQKISACKLKIESKLFLFFLNFYDEKTARKKAETSFFKFFGCGKLLNDELISRGEYFTAKTLSVVFGGSFCDPKDLIYLRENGLINFEKTAEHAKNALISIKNPPFICGFYGNQNGKIKLFPRGGGDESGAILSSVLNADLYVNYTDRCGIKNAPPDITDCAKTIKKICYSDLKTLCFSGANVLSEEAATLICRKKLKTAVKNAIVNNPNAQKTITAKKRKHVFKAISFKKSNNGLCSVFLLGKGLKSKKNRKKAADILNANTISFAMRYDKKSVRFEINETNAEKAIKLLYITFIASKTCRKKSAKNTVKRS